LRPVGPASHLGRYLAPRRDGPVLDARQARAHVSLRARLRTRALGRRRTRPARPDLARLRSTPALLARRSTAQPASPREAPARRRDEGLLREGAGRGAQKLPRLARSAQALRRR